MADVQYAVERLDAAVRSLRELAATDHLTGAHNRRAAEGRLAEDVGRARCGEGTLTLLDLDRFKPVNDEHGHRAGDACLIHFAELLASNLCEGDWVARCGGDEFLLGVWHAEEGLPAERVLGRVAEVLRENPMALLNGEEALLNLSGGIGRWRPGDDSGRLLSRADEALYRAKAKGGNTIEDADWGVSDGSALANLPSTATAGGSDGQARGRSPTRHGGRTSLPPGLGGAQKGLLSPPDEDLGRGRGGFSTKVHLACDGRGCPSGSW